jgi:hypothetical protein
MSAPRRGWWIADATLLSVCALGVGLAFILAPGAERVALAGFEIPEICFWKRVLGMGCPGCGLTRSWVYLAHGDIWTAVSMNAAGPLLFTVAVVQIPVTGLRLLRGALAVRAASGPDGGDEEGRCPA